jgi:hypothetical protein
MDTFELRVKELLNTNDMAIELLPTFEDFLNRKMNEEILKGGKGDGKSENDYDPFEFELGIAVESEHTDNLEEKKEIVMDHLEENPSYYTEGFAKEIFDEDISAIVFSDKWKDDPRAIKLQTNSSENQ